MSHSTTWQAAVFSSLIAVLAGCGGGGNGNSAFDNPPAPEPPAPAQTEFTMLVRDSFANTADDTDPVDVAELDLLFSDQDNAEAFDDLLE